MPSTVLELIGSIDASHAVVCAEQRQLFRRIADLDRHSDWQEEQGAHDTAHFVAMHYDNSYWKASRWVDAALALESLPRLSRAFETAELGIDKVVELTRFSTPETEEGLIAWAWRVSTGAIRHRAELEARREAAEAAHDQAFRELSRGFYDDGRRYRLSAELPASNGAIVDRAVDRALERVPVMPGEDDDHYLPNREADALVAICSGSLASDPDVDRATVIVHAELAALASGDRGCELEAGGVTHVETARRLLCDGRVQVVAEDASGRAFALGRTSRVPTVAMVRQLRYRHRECRFPSCGSRRFLQAHRIVWWDRGGRTDLDNLALICTWHHRLVHELGWSIRRDPDRTVNWFDPDGFRYDGRPRSAPVAVGVGSRGS